MTDLATPAVKAGRLHSLEVQDFKSYKGLHIVGPFANFSAIIGPNGSGKSNLMDAISFICGVRTGDGQLRGNLKELLYNDKNSALAEDHPGTGRVSLVFEHENGVRELFTRSIVPSGSGDSTSYASKYSIGPATVTLDEFNKRMLSLGINTKARNFLVFQGDVQRVAAQSPSDLARLFELVSGSESLKGEYEQLQADASSTADEEVHLHGKVKVLRTRARVIKDAKDEAERFSKQSKALEGMRRQKFLWQLYHVRQDWIEAQQCRAEQEAVLAALRARFSEDLASQSSIDKERAALKKQQAAAARKVDKLKLERDKQNPLLVRLREMAVRTNRDLEGKRRAIETHRSKRDELQRSVRQMSANASKVSKALERAKSEAGQVGDVALTPEQRAEYLRLKAEADQKTYEDRMSLATKAQQLDSDTSAIAAAQEHVDHFAARSERLKSEVLAKKQDEAAALAADQAQRRSLDGLAAALKAAEDARRQNATKRQQYRDQLAGLEKESGMHRSHFNSSRKERKAKEAIEKMRERLGDDVLGRTTDVTTVKSQKHNVALAALMGRHMDSVVVRTMATAQACVKLLKEEKREPMEFIPLDNIKVPVISDRLRGLADAHLAVDLMECDRHVAPAIAFALGNALVADSLAVAKRLAFEQGHKAAALDGTIVRSNGAMSGGNSSNFAARSTRWDQAAHKRVEDAIRAVHAKLEKLPDEQEAQAAESAAMRALDAAKLESNSCNAALDLARAQVAAKQREAADAADELAAKKVDLSRLDSKEVKALKKEVDRLRKRVDAVRDEVLRAFSKRVGVANIRQHEEKMAADEAKREERVSELSRHLGSLRAEEERARNGMGELELKIERDETAAQMLEEELRQVDEKKTAAAAESGAIGEQMKEAEAALDSARSKLSDLASRRDDANRARRKLEAESAAPQQEVARLDRELDALAHSAAAIEQDAMLANVDLDAQSESRAAAANGDSDVSSDGQDGERAAERGAEGAAASMPQALRRDFAAVPRKLRGVLVEGARVKTAKALQKDIDALAEELDGLAPNMHAPAEYDEVQQQLKAILQELEEVKARSRQAEGRFMDVKERRTALFNAAFAHVSAAIDGIYKCLTRTAESASGGVAYLNMSQDDAPFDGGVVYAAIPPRKRFRDMGQLSGGEKTLAALALLLAMHSYKPAPFLVLDEVDAALDMSNLERVAMYVRECTREAHPQKVQGIVISLKDAFYEKADVLVGITKRQHAANCSQVFTFDLSPYGPPQVTA